MWHFEFLGKVLQVPVLLLVAMEAVLYLALVVAVYKMTEYVFGDEAARKVTSYTIGLPIIFIANIANRIWLAVSWPRRYRNRRLFKEIFEIEHLDSQHQEENQEKVDEVLASRARWMDVAFGKQEKARRSGDEQALNDAEEEISGCKELFWSAHNLARKNGFDVYERYSDYLKK